MKKTNVSSEVLHLPKNLEKCAPRTHPGRTRFGRQNGPQNESKSSPKLAPFLDPFLVQSWGSFWGSFGCLLGPKTGPGEVWKSLREPSGAPRGQKDDFQKSGFRMRLSAFFLALETPLDGPKRPRRLPKSVPRELRNIKQEPPTQA